MSRTLTPPKNKGKQARAPKSGRTKGAGAGYQARSKPAPVTRGAQVHVRPASIKASSKDGLRVEGTDWAGRVAIPAAGMSAAQLIYKQVVRPTMITNSRIAQLARLYEYYRVHGITFHLTSSQPTTATGSVVAYFDYDSEDPEPSGDAGLQAAFGHRINQTSKLYESFDIKVPPDPSKLHREKYTDPQPINNGVTIRDSDLDFGTLYIMSLDQSNVAAGSSLYNVFVSYDIELYGANYDPVTASTIYIERAKVPVADISSHGSSIPVSGIKNINLVNDLSTGVRDAALNINKTMDELKSYAGMMADIKDRGLASIKGVTDLLNTVTSTSGDDGKNALFYGTSMILQPGTYKATMTFSAANSVGTLMGNLERNHFGGRGAVDYLSIVFWTEGNTTAPNDAVSQPLFYEVPGAISTTTGIVGKDFTYLIEFTVKYTVRLAFYVRSIVADGSAPAAFLGGGGATHVRITLIVRADSLETRGITWTPIAGANGDDTDEYEYQTEGTATTIVWKRPDQPGAAQAGSGYKPGAADEGDSDYAACEVTSHTSSVRSLVAQSRSAAAVLPAARR